MTLRDLPVTRQTRFGKGQDGGVVVHPGAEGVEGLQRQSGTASRPSAVPSASPTVDGALAVLRYWARAPHRREAARYWDIATLIGTTENQPGNQ
jgi:fermentation-respiration switch protein FrsA (DUF1100 family)